MKIMVNLYRYKILESIFDHDNTSIIQFIHSICWSLLLDDHLKPTCLGRGSIFQRVGLSFSWVGW